MSSCLPALEASILPEHAIVIATRARKTRYFTAKICVVMLCRAEVPTVQSSPRAALPAFAIPVGVNEPSADFYPRWDEKSGIWRDTRSCAHFLASRPVFLHSSHYRHAVFIYPLLAVHLFPIGHAALCRFVQQRFLSPRLLSGFCDGTQRREEPSIRRRRLRLPR